MASDCMASDCMASDGIDCMASDGMALHCMASDGIDCMASDCMALHCMASDCMALDCMASDGIDCMPLDSIRQDEMIKCRPFAQGPKIFDKEGFSRAQVQSMCPHAVVIGEGNPVGCQPPRGVPATLSP